MKSLRTVTLLLVFLTACAMESSQTAPPGLAIGSITYDGAIGARWILLKNESTGKVFRVEAGQSQTLNPFAKPEVEPGLGEIGATFAVSLPAGSYVVGPWIIRQGPTSVSSRSPIGFEFSVESGQAVYIGNYHFKQTSGFGLGTGSAEVTLTEKYERDLRALKAKLALAEGVPVAVSLPLGTEIVGVGGDSRKSLGRLGPTFVVPAKR